MQRFTARSVRTTVPMVLAAILVLGAGYVYAGGRGQHPGPHGPRQGAMLERMLDRLDLSEEQKEALDKPLQAHRETMDADRDKMFEARRSLEDAVHAETFDEAAIRHAVRAVAEVEAGMAVSRAGMLRDLRKVLTPAQRDKLETMRQNRQEFMQERFQGGPDSGRRLRDRD